MMIKQLNIENFQSWKETELVFSPGINLIIGESDEGKSAIIRALTWPINNHPLGDEFINDSSPDNLCAVEVETGLATISRAKGKGVNLYYLDDTEFNAFGRNPPEEIVETFKISPLNIQAQKDNFFLFNDSAPDVGRYLNTIIDLTVIDRSLSHANKRIKRTNAEITALDRQKNEYEKEIQETDWVVKADKDLRQIEKLEKEQEEFKKTVGHISSLVLDIGEAYEKIDRSDALLDFHPDLKKIEGELAKQEERKKEKVELARLINFSRQAEEDILSNSIILEFKDQVEDLIKLDSATDKLENEADELESLITKIQDSAFVSSDLVEKLESLENQFYELMPDSCPLCGSKI